MTRQFDVYRNPLRGSREERPFVVVIQHDFLSDRPSRVAMPLVVKHAIHPVRRLNPLIDVLGTSYYLSPTETVALPVRLLREAVDNLARERDRIVSALDYLFSGV
ncbi:MAG TPA: CcdB family protein [Rhizomicrobium sp.]|jgi:toxin CcdB|nr:CcdB family protein [Rhizomicrobium sp.]